MQICKNESLLIKFMKNVYYFELPCLVVVYDAFNWPSADSLTRQ
jgi:hypothetical protein